MYTYLYYITPKGKSMDTKLKIAIIGCGGIAHAHMSSYLKMEDAQVVALCDIIPGKAESFAKEFELCDVKFYTNHKEMLQKEQLDAVSICTYNVTHCECTVDALKAGVHVMLEKPMSVTLEEGIEMMRAEKESGKILSIGFQPRFAPMTKTLRDIVQADEVGEVYYIQTGGGRRRGIPNRTFIEKKTAGIGALGDIGCYALDLVLYALDYPTPTTVSAYKSDFFGKSTEYQKPEDASRFDVDDFAAAFIRFDTGLVIDFRIAWAMHIDSPGDTIMLGKKGGIRIPATDCWNYGPGGDLTIYHDVAGKQVETVIPADMDFANKKDLFYNKIRSFLDAIKTGGKAPVPTSQIIKNQAILDAIQRSAELGREVEVKIPEV